MKKPKNPTLAAGLNFFLMGSGYIYVGKRTIFGWLIFISYLITIFSPQSQDAYQELANDPLVLLSGFLTMIAFAWDAWQEAKATQPAKEQK